MLYGAQKADIKLFNDEKLLSNYLMIILQLYLRFNITQFMEKDFLQTLLRVSKYQLLNKCFKNYQ